MKSVMVYKHGEGAAGELTPEFVCTCKVFMNIVKKITLFHKKFV